MSKKKRKSKSVPVSHQGLQPSVARDSSASVSTTLVSQAPPPPPPPPPLPTASLTKPHSISRDRIWNTSTQEERERIKEFWLSLSEEDRRSLVKVEKEAVLRKMKEQQKHSCSCTVCGRKRTAIEEELEVLYDAYYEELEQYANHQQTSLESGGPMLPPPRRHGHTGHLHASSRLAHGGSERRLPKERVEELPDDEDEEVEDYSEEEEEEEEEEEGEEDYSDEDLEVEEARGPAADFFNFGNSLTVQGGILTVADDLLKNDGRKFIEMMEQLAERRMQREEDAQYAATGFAHAPMNLPGQHSHAGHNHPPLPEDEEYDEEEDEDYDSQEDEDYDDEEMDAMTEEQRMEEGRRMFQIFAARMFEQRVLTAYREKVAQERQKKLLEELEEESRQDVQREQKKAKEAQKKKDKKRLQKLAKDGEKARKEAERAEEEAAARAVEEKKAEELRLKKEEQRKKREAEKKSLEEERLRKEAEKQRRMLDERERQAEQERKHREQKEREKKKREEAKRKEREEREAKDKELREKAVREEKERKEREAKLRAERETKDRAKKQELAAQKAAAHALQMSAHTSKRTAQMSSQPAPPGFQPPSNPKATQSPHLQIATPAIPKAPVPSRPRQTSQQGSVTSSPQTPQGLIRKGQSASPSITSQHSSPGPVGPPRKTSVQHQNFHNSQPPNFTATTVPPLGPALASHTGFSSVPLSTMNGISTTQPLAHSGLAQRGQTANDGIRYSHQQPPIGTQFRASQATGIVPVQPPLNAMRSLVNPRGLFAEGIPGLPFQSTQQPFSAPTAQSYGVPRDTMPTHSHSRNQSASMETPMLENVSMLPPTQPISRPAPIKRPSSVAFQRLDESHRAYPSDVDELSKHLGSSALLEENDEAFLSEAALGRRASMAPMSQAPGPNRSRYSFASMYPQAGQHKPDMVGLRSPGVAGNSWAVPPVPLGGPGLPRTSTWSQSPSTGWSNANAFGIIGIPNRPTLSRPVNVRLLIVQACKQLTAAKQPGDDFHDVSILLSLIEQIRPSNEAPVQMREMLEICETEGDSHNGGGYFIIKTDGSGRTLVKYEGGGNVPRSARGSVAPGEIGSPIQGSSMPAFGGGHFPSVSSIASPSGF